jgi:hypothetical protein
VVLLNYYGTAPCTGIEVSIYDSSEYNFVTRRQLLNHYKQLKRRIAGNLLKEFHLTKLKER